MYYWKVSGISFTELVKQINRWNKNEYGGLHPEGCRNERACWTKGNWLVGITMESNLYLTLAFYFLEDINTDFPLAKHEHQLYRWLKDLMNAAVINGLLQYSEPLYDNDNTPYGLLDISHEEAVDWFMGEKPVEEECKSQVISQEKGRPGRPHKPEDIWLWKQVNQDGRPKDLEDKKALIKEWKSQMPEGRQSTLIDLERQYQFVIKPDWKR